MDRFWDAKSQMFRAPELSSETVPSDALHDRGYTFWPSLIGMHTLIEAERQNYGSHFQQISMVYDGLEKYFNRGMHAYNAWLYFPGNNDAYFDDNSWAVITLVEAHNATIASDPAKSQIYLKRAADIMDRYVMKGWDPSGHPGGVSWGSDATKPNTSDKGTSATAGTALAALMLARAGVDTSRYTRLGHDVLSWLTDRLTDKDGLIMDALVPPGWTPRTIKWTYNTGVPMRAYIEHYRLTQNNESLQRATELARAAINRNGALFDQTPHDPDKRYYWDSGYFVQYLIDGLLQVAETTRDADLSANIIREVVRNANYAYAYMRDESDGFYWRNWNLCAIGSAQVKAWEQWTGQTATLAPDASERSQDPRYSSLPIEQRPLVKTLLANAGTARLFWLASRLPKNLSESI
jgi:predicted alpha-1,6-mannanase (GH76 family)